MGWEQFAIYLPHMFQDMRHFDIKRQARNGRLHGLDVFAPYRYEVDSPAKSFHGDVDLDRFLDGRSHTKCGRERDSRRQNLYDAQRDAQKSISIESFESLRETARFVGDILRRAWWQRRYQNTSVFLKPGYGARRGKAKGRHTILLPNPQRTDLMVLHELIHHTVPAPHAGHGRLYCARFLEIIGWHYGEEAREALKSAYRKQNVKWHPRHAPPDVDGTDPHDPTH